MKGIMMNLVDKFSGNLDNIKGFDCISFSCDYNDESASTNIIFEEKETGNTVHVEVYCDTEDIIDNTEMDKRILKTLGNKLLIDREYMEPNEVEDLLAQIKYIENKVNGGI